MDVSYSMVRGVYSGASSTALRQPGGYQNRLRPDIHYPFTRKVMSRVVNNDSQLKKLLNLNVTIWAIGSMPKKARHNAAKEGKWPFHFMAHGVLTWI